VSIERYRQSVHDEVMTSALVRAADNLLDDLVDRSAGHGTSDRPRSSPATVWTRTTTQGGTPTA
jgi:hypothetical protein